MMKQRHCQKLTTWQGQLCNRNTNGLHSPTCMTVFEHKLLTKSMLQTNEKKAIK